MRPWGWPKTAWFCHKCLPGEGHQLPVDLRGGRAVTLLSDSREETRSRLAASAADSDLGPLQEVCCGAGI